MKRRKPTSPGEILQEEFLKPLQLSQKELAEHIGCDYKVINRIVNERSSVTPEMAITVDLWHLESKRLKIRPLIRLRRKKAIHSPQKEY